MTIGANANVVTTTNTRNTNAIRDDVWAMRIKEELEQELMAQSIVEFIQSDFPDGDTLHIPELYSLVAQDYTENSLISVQNPNVTDFTLTIDQYKQSGFAVADKFKEDTFYMNMITNHFPFQVVRAIMEQLERDIMDLHKGQTSNDANIINGRAHRFVGTGSGTTMSVNDFRTAKLALDDAFVSKVGRTAIISPKAAHDLIGQDEIIRQDVYGPNSNLKEGFGATHYIGRYMGFEIYESNMLDEDTALNHVAGGTQTGNLFFGPEAFIGAIRTMPDIEAFRDSAYRRDVYHVVTRYGLKLYRPESLVTVLTTT